MPKFELTKTQYLDLTVDKLKENLSDKCTILYSADKKLIISWNFIDVEFLLETIFKYYDAEQSMETTANIILKQFKKELTEQLLKDVIKEK